MRVRALLLTIGLFCSSTAEAFGQNESKSNRHYFASTDILVIAGSEDASSIISYFRTAGAAVHKSTCTASVSSACMLFLQMFVTYIMFD